MEQERVEGAAEVAALLRRMAEGVEAGAVTLGDRQVACHQDLAATVEVPAGEEGRLLLVVLRLADEHRLGRPLAVERELSHPGG